MFLGDGMGLATVAAARLYQKETRGLSKNDTYLTWERFPFAGLSRVRSSLFDYLTTMEIIDVKTIFPFLIKLLSLFFIYFLFFYNVFIIPYFTDSTHFTHCKSFVTCKLLQPTTYSCNFAVYSFKFICLSRRYRLD